MAETFVNQAFNDAQSAVGVRLGSTVTSTGLLSGLTGVTVNGTVDLPNSPVTLDLNVAGTVQAGLPATYVGFSQANPSAEPVYYFDVTPVGLQVPVTVAVSAGTVPAIGLITPINTTANVSAPDSPTIVCFVTGTKIRTSRGEVAVEDLQVGDHAVTASGTLRPITWIGHREIIAKSGSLTFNQQPVRVRAGAFGGGQPVRDLSMSPGHPVLVGADADNEGGALVPVMCLINGTTITREPVANVTYWHIELDAHDILLAEGLPAESYIDGGDRAFFSEASDHALHNPDFVAPGWDGRCRPVALDGPLVEAERLRLDAVFTGSLNAQCGWDSDSSYLAA